MAQVKLSGLVTSIKGSVGGTTFQSSGAGLTARNKPLPLKSKSNAQTTVRVLQAQLNTAWGDLTDAQRQTWASFSEFTNGSGKTHKRNNSANTGKMQFLTVNFWLLQYGKSILTTPSFALPLNPVIPCPPLYNESDNLMNYDGTLDTSSQILVTRVSLPQSLSTKTANTGFRTLVYTQVDGSSQNWAAAYLATFGVSLVLGKKYWIEYRVVDFLTGAISAAARKLVKYVAPDNSLKLTVNTTLAGSPTTDFVLPCANIGTYNAVIDWGDDSTSTITAYNDADLSHTYAVGGVYTISITGALPAIFFNNGGDKVKLIDIVQWGGWQPLQLGLAFFGCNNLTGSATDALDLSQVTNLNQAFRGCSSLQIDVSSWDMSPITNMALAFYQCSSWNPDLAAWDVSNVTSFSNCFYQCTAFNPDISSWDVSSCTVMTFAFGLCTSFASDVSGWDVSSLVSANAMFSGCSSFDSDMSAWDVSALLNGSDFCLNSGLSTANLDLIYNNWSLLTLQTLVIISFNPTTYTISTSQAGRDILTNAPNNWTVIDGGGI